MTCHTRQNKTHSSYSTTSGIGGGGASAGAPPKVLICRKFEQNCWKCEQNGAQRCSISKYGTQHFQKNT